MVALATSPDRTRIAFARAVAQESGSGDAGSVDCHDGELVIVDLRTNTRRVWTVPQSSLTDLDWSPDGTQLAYGLQTRDVGADTARAYLLDLATANGPRPASATTTSCWHTTGTVAGWSAGPRWPVAEPAESCRASPSTPQAPTCCSRLRAGTARTRTARPVPPPPKARNLVCHERRGESLM